MSMPRVGLRRTRAPRRPSRARRTSGRSAWFSMPEGSNSESASTVPSRSTTVSRTPPAAPRRRTASWRASPAGGRSTAARLARLVSRNSRRRVSRSTI